MDNRQKQQALIKLAKVQLAIDHVRRKRALEKQAQAPSPVTRPVPHKNPRMIPPPLVPPRQPVNSRPAQPQQRPLFTPEEIERSNRFFEQWLRPADASDETQGARNRNRLMEAESQNTQPTKPPRPWYKFW